MNGAGSTLDVEVLLGRAGSSAQALLELLDTIKAAHIASRSDLTESRAENTALRKEIADLKSRNRALLKVRDRLIAERQADKQTISAWQARLAETAPVQSEASTQDQPAAYDPVPSSPPHTDLGGPLSPSSQHGSPVQEPLSQRVLPMSIGVSENDNDDKDDGVDVLEPQGWGRADSPVALLSSPVSSESGDSNKGAARAASKAAKTALTCEEGKPSRALFIEELRGRTWHPTDFKPNPKHRTASTDLHPSKRSCRAQLRGADCPECSNFYKAAGIQQAIDVCSRHRSAIEKQQTPPGFWEMDFPHSSQVSDLRAAEKDQMHAIAEERLLEALGGGRYLFRDDSINRKLS